MRMFDDEDRLRECPALRQLLEHYDQLSAADATAWQDRWTELPGAKPKELVQWHGELIAHDWIEQNTGVVSFHKPGVVAACYRITSDGRRALRRTAAVAELETAERAA
jgi:hypothetical protein